MAFSKRTVNSGSHPTRKRSGPRQDLKNLPPNSSLLASKIIKKQKGFKRLSSNTLQLRIRYIQRNIPQLAKRLNAMALQSPEAVRLSESLTPEERVEWTRIKTTERERKLSDARIRLRDSIEALQAERVAIQQILQARKAK